MQHLKEQVYKCLEINWAVDTKFETESWHIDHILSGEHAVRYGKHKYNSVQIGVLC
jgi:hypothetical protein